MAEAIRTSTYNAADLDRFAAELNRDGITTIRGLIDRALVAQWKDAFDALFAERQSRPGGLAPREQSRYYLTLPWVPPFVDPTVWAPKLPADAVRTVTQGISTAVPADVISRLRRIHGTPFAGTAMPEERDTDP